MFRLLIFVIQSKKFNITQKLVKLKKDSNHDHNNKYITTQEFNTLMSETFASRLRQENLATKGDFANFRTKTDFDDKLKKLNKKFALNKTKHVEAEKKRTGLTNKSTQKSEK